MGHAAVVINMFRKLCMQMLKADTSVKEIPHNTAAHSQRDLLRGAGGAFSDAKLVL